MTEVSEVKDLVEKQGKTFEEFKAANDKRLDALEKGFQDVVTEEKVNKINEDLTNIGKQLEELQTKMNRPAKAGGDDPENKGEDDPVAQHKAAFYGGFIRKGHDDGLTELEQKALSVGTDADGGYAVPEELDRSIAQILQQVSPIRAISRVVTVGSANYKKLVNTHGTGSGWVGETAARPETGTPQFAEVAPPLGEIYADPGATQQMLDDVFFNVENWLSDEVSTEFAQQEGGAFINGNGTNKPKGFLDKANNTNDDASRAFGTLQYVVTGNSGAFPSSDPSDVLLDLVYALRSGYRMNARWVMNTNLLAEIRKFKDSNGNYIWQPGLQQGEPQRLLGYPVTEAPDMPDTAADSLSVTFGDFSRGYVITDRMGTRVLRDPFTNKPYVHFYTTRRVGGDVENSDAIKLLKFGTS